MSEQRFEGHENRECGVHQPGPHRAWCFACSEWCYPRAEAACRGCELPMLRARSAALWELLKRAARARRAWEKRARSALDDGVADLVAAQAAHRRDLVREGNRATMLREEIERLRALLAEAAGNAHQANGEAP